MATVIEIRATVVERPCGSPHDSSTGANSSASVAAPNAADRKPAKVTPICSAARKRFGFEARENTRCPRRPRAASVRSWLSRSDTSAISVAAKAPPMQTKTTTRAIFAQVELTHPSVGAPAHPRCRSSARADGGLEVARDRVQELLGGLPRLVRPDQDGQVLRHRAAL